VEIKVDALRDKMDERFEKVNERFAKVDEKLANLDQKFTERFGELRVWALIVIGGGVLSVVARAFHWL
jgi:hypothetical protein